MGHNKAECKTERKQRAQGLTDVDEHSWTEAVGSYYCACTLNIIKCKLLEEFKFGQDIQLLKKRLVQPMALQ